MLNLFRNNSIFAIIFAFFFLVLLRLSPFFQTITADLNINAPLAQFLFSWFQSFPDYYYFSIVSASLLVFIQAWLVNHITVQHSILEHDSFLPGLVFILLNSLYPAQMFLSPQLMANLFIILMFQRLCYLYEAEKPLYFVLDGGLYLGMAILFNYDTLVYLPFILISVVLMTYFNIRYLLVSIFGILLPLYLLGVAFFLFDNLNELQLIINNSLERTYINDLKIDWIKIIPWLTVTGIVLISGVSLQSNYFKNKVKTRRILFTVALFILVSFVIVVIEDHNVVYALSYLTVPTSIIMANYFLSKKLFYLKEILFVSLIIMATFYQYIIH